MLPLPSRLPQRKQLLSLSLSSATLSLSTNRMQPCSREMQGGLNLSYLLNTSQISPQDLHPSNFDPLSATQSDHDFLDQMFSSISPTTCSWPDLSPIEGGAAFNHFDESSLLASKLRQHQISSSTDSGGTSAAKVMMMQQQMMMSRGFNPSQGDIHGEEDSVQALLNGFSGSLPPTPHFPLPQGGSPSFVAKGQVVKSGPAGSVSTTATSVQPRQRVRARRGQATDPHSIAERLRRERIAERMKSLQELVPNANKTDKASMLDEIIDYVKFLQLQVKVLSMSRLSGAAAGTDMSSQGGGGSNDSLTVTEHQVVKLMEEDMGSAMQYLQGKGLCLMPISLATAISTATCHSGRNTAAAVTALHGNSNGDVPTSPSMSVLTVQSALVANGGGLDRLSSTKDPASVTQP